MEREKVAEVLIDLIGIRQNLEQHFPSLAFIEKKNLGDEIPITLPQAKILFEKASQFHSFSNCSTKGLSARPVSLDVSSANS
jgi:hypothetical protein